MTLFSVLAIPLFSMGITTYYYKDRFSINLPLLTFLKGIICFFIALLFYLIIRSFFHQSYTGWGLYLYHLVYDHFLYIVLSICGLFLFNGIPDGYNQQENVFESYIFFSGFFTLVAFVDFIEYSKRFDFFILFLLPLLRISTILAVTIFLIQFINNTSYLRFAFLSGLILLPFILNLITVLFLGKLIFFAIILTLIIFGGALFLFYFYKDG
jgi:hypothetical protein